MALDIMKPILSSHVVELEGVKIGIIGYLTEETKNISNTEQLIFNNVVETIQNESKESFSEEEL